MPNTTADDLAWIGLRPYSRGDSLVLVDADPPTLVNDRALASAGIVELPAWSVHASIGGDGDRVIPAPLPFLDWGATGIEPRSLDPQQFPYGRDRRACRSRPQSGRVGRTADLRSEHPDWFDLITSLVEVGLSRQCHHPRDCAQRIRISARRRGSRPRIVRNRPPVRSAQWATVTPQSQRISDTPRSTCCGRASRTACPGRSVPPRPGGGHTSDPGGRDARDPPQGARIDVVGDRARRRRRD